jgi:co-chaperonin GroES (HSP10)
MVAEQEAIKAKALEGIDGDSNMQKEEKLAQQLPTPTGYKILIGLPKIEDKYDSGILKADNVIRDDTVATVVGFVLDLGPDAYQDKAKFPNGPYCKKGDFVLLRTYSGTRFKIHGVEFRLINDDTVDAVVSDPRGFSRA